MYFNTVYARELEIAKTEIKCNRVAKWAKDFHISVGSGWNHPPPTDQNTKTMVSDSCEHLLVSSIWSTHWDHLQNVEPHSLWQRPEKMENSSMFSAKNFDKKHHNSIPVRISWEFSFRLGLIVGSRSSTPFWKSSTNAESTNIHDNKRTNLHWPMMTLSPSFTRKAGDTWADKFEWRFSYLEADTQVKADIKKVNLKPQTLNKLLKIPISWFQLQGKSQMRKHSLEYRSSFTRSRVDFLACEKHGCRHYSMMR